VRFLSGHYLGKSVEMNFASRPFHRVILLREPQSFHISYYNYRMMRYLDSGWRTYSFDTHLRSQPDDAITDFILSRWLEIPWRKLLSIGPVEKWRLVNSELSKFWYVADYTTCDELCTLISREIGISETFERANTTANWLERVQWKPLTAEDLTPKQKALIQAKSQLDLPLWNTWRAAKRDVASVVPAQPALKKSSLQSALVRPLFAVGRRWQRGWD
jgi:hypothetical protein